MTTDPSDNPWARPSNEVADSLVTECHRELSPGHPLYGETFSAIARCQGCDDVVLRLSNDRGFALVHLTWSGKPEQPPWPSAELLPTYLALEAAIDHHAH